MGMSVDSIKTEAAKLVAPAKALSDVFLGTAEKMVALQMDSCDVYKEIAFGQLKKIPGIYSVETAGDFFWGQIEPISEVNKQILSDCKAVMALNSDFTSGVKTALTPAKKAKSTTKTAAKTTAKPKTVKSIIPEEKPEPVTKITKAKRSTAAKKTTTAEKTTTPAS